MSASDNFNEPGLTHYLLRLEIFKLFGIRTLLHSYILLKTKRALFFKRGLWPMEIFF